MKEKRVNILLKKKETERDREGTDREQRMLQLITRLG